MFAIDFSPCSSYLNNEYSLRRIDSHNILKHAFLKIPMVIQYKITSTMGQGASVARVTINKGMDLGWPHIVVSWLHRATMAVG